MLQTSILFLRILKVKQSLISYQNQLQLTKQIEYFKCHNFDHFVCQCPTRSLLIDFSPIVDELDLPVVCHENKFFLPTHVSSLAPILHRLRANLHRHIIFSDDT